MTWNDISQSLLNEIHMNTLVLPPGVLYFKRLDKPSTNTVVYSLSYLLAEGKRNQTNCLIWDVRKLSNLTGGLQLTIVRQIPLLCEQFDHVAVVWDQTHANRWKSSFIKRMPIFHTYVGFSFHFTMEEAIQHLTPMVKIA